MSKPLDREAIKWVCGSVGDDGSYTIAGDDTIFGDGVVRPGTLESVPGAEHGNDVLVGGAGDNWVEGGQRDDTLYGGSGNDTMFGDGAGQNEATTFEGHDWLDGEDGDGKLTGGGNDDTLFGRRDKDMILPRDIGQWRSVPKAANVEVFTIRNTA